MHLPLGPSTATVRDLVALQPSSVMDRDHINCYNSCHCSGSETDYDSLRSVRTSSEGKDKDDNDEDEGEEITKLQKYMQQQKIV